MGLLRYSYQWHSALSEIVSLVGQCGDNCELTLFLERKVGVTKRPRSLYPGEAASMATFPIIVYFNTKCARAHR